ncbi:MAG: hypothetical protein GX589_06965 [Deltaproteobacteria bacterium]|nr:hypothetical protein [Deltaproteobacteria bacterium]
MTSSQSRSRLKPSALLALMIVAAVLLLKLPLQASLWLDETITFWITDGSFAEAVLRSVTYQGESPLYFILIRDLRNLFQPQEWVLRAPSLLALALSGALIFALACKLFNKESGVFAVIFFVSNPQVLKAALSARPYSLALLCSLASVLSLIHWFERGQLKHRLAYALSTLLAIYFHFLFAGVLLVHFSYYLLFPAPTRRVKAAKLWSTWVWIGILLMPAAPQLFCLFTRRESLLFGEVPGLLDLARSLYHPTAAIYFVCALAIAATFRSFTLLPGRFFSKPLVKWLLIWLLAGPLLFWAYSILSNSAFFINRFFLWQTPALALLFAGLLQSIEPAKSRLLSLAILCLMVSGHLASLKWQIEDWRGAAAAIDASWQEKKSPVLVYSGLIELQQPKWLLDHRRWDYLLAPFKAYSVEAPLYPLPANPQAEQMQEYMESLQNEVIGGQNEFILAALQIKDPQGSGYAHQNLSDYFKSRGFISEKMTDAGLVHLLKFRKP